MLVYLIATIPLRKLHSDFANSGSLPRWFKTRTQKKCQDFFKVYGNKNQINSHMLASWDAPRCPLLESLSSVPMWISTLDWKAVEVQQHTHTHTQIGNKSFVLSSDLASQQNRRLNSGAATHAHSFLLCVHMQRLTHTHTNTHTDIHLLCEWPSATGSVFTVN